MSSKKIFSFDEEKDAEIAIEQGFENSLIDYNKMHLIAKYFRDKFNYGAIRLEREIIKFCKEQNKNFNPVTEAESIKKWVRSAMNYDLRKVEGVTISQVEIDTLKEVELEKDRRLLFATLVFSKALRNSSTRRKNAIKRTTDNYYIRYNNLLDIIRVSGVKNVSELNFIRILHKYKKWFQSYSPEKELIKILFIDHVQENPIEITEMDDIMRYYEIYYGKMLTECEDCGKLFSRKANNQTRCTECSLKKRRETQRELMRKRREK
jgi:hypothetical protein